jgi:CPA1 family monovalent cation:H+ antiporter
MPLIDVLALLIIMAAIFSYINHVIFRLPETIGLLLAGLTAAAVLLIADRAAPAMALTDEVQRAIAGIDFSGFLLRGILCFLLFAGALHLDVEDLRREKLSILVLAFAGLVISTAIIGLGSFALFRLFSVQISLAYCLVFGVVVSPTDPIAVIGIMKTAGAPRDLEVRLTGESLFNDGIAVVLFSALSVIATTANPTVGTVGRVAALIFLREAIGGVALGLVTGFVTYRLMKRIDEPNVEVLLSVALVTAISLVAANLHTSGPLASVVAGLFIGNQGRRFAMRDASRQALDVIWSFLDYVLNAVLFLLLGLETVLLWRNARELVIMLAFIPLTLAARWLSVSASVTLLRRRVAFLRGWLTILVWGGLRGGISLALALSLPRFAGRDVVVAVTYGIVIFSIVVQGLTVRPLLERTSAGRGPSGTARSA